jgi:hypothetical protein
MCFILKHGLLCGCDYPGRTIEKYCINESAKETCIGKFHFGLTGNFEMRSKTYSLSPTTDSSHIGGSIQLVATRTGAVHIAIVAQDRVCSKCRSEDLSRPLEESKWLNVPYTMDPNGVAYKIEDRKVIRE